MEFKTGVIRPVECFREGWELIKNQYWLFFGITIVGMLLGGLVPFGIILGAMMCGIYYCLFQKANNQTVSFDGLFKGFDYFKASLIVTLFVIVPAFLLWLFAYVPLLILQIQMQQSRGRVDPDIILPLFIGIGSVVFVCGVVLACIHALIMFAYPLIVEYRLSGMEALKLSARAVWKNLSGVVGLILCEFALGLLGYLLCIVGVYFTIPLMFAGVFVAYRKVFPPGDFAASAASPFAPPPAPDFANQNEWR